MKELLTKDVGEQSYGYFVSSENLKQLFELDMIVPSFEGGIWGDVLK